jgi:hypothetical protein
MACLNFKLRKHLQYCCYDPLKIFLDSHSNLHDFLTRFGLISREKMQSLSSIFDLMYHNFQSYFLLSCYKLVDECNVKPQVLTSIAPNSNNYTVQTFH